MLPVVPEGQQALTVPADIPPGPNYGYASWRIQQLGIGANYLQVVTKPASLDGAPRLYTIKAFVLSSEEDSQLCGLEVATFESSKPGQPDQLLTVDDMLVKGRTDYFSAVMQPGVTAVWINPRPCHANATVTVMSGHVPLLMLALLGLATTSIHEQKHPRT
eukprot:scaffold251532_cov29-Prasinocladus_malaysianus.AAC.1